MFIIHFRGHSVYYEFKGHMCIIINFGATACVILCGVLHHRHSSLSRKHVSQNLNPAPVYRALAIPLTVGFRSCITSWDNLKVNARLTKEIKLKEFTSLSCNYINYLLSERSKAKLDVGLCWDQTWMLKIS